MNNKENIKEKLINELTEIRNYIHELNLYIKEKYPSDSYYGIKDVNHVESLEFTSSTDRNELIENSIILKAELDNTRLLQRLSTELLCENNIKAMYEKIIDAAMQIMSSEYASMQMLHTEQGERDKLQLLAFRGFNPKAAEFWEWVYPEAGSTCSEALRTGRRIIVRDVRECKFINETEDRYIYLQTGINAVQTTPLYSRDGKMLGMISTHWSNPHNPSERELRLLDVLARQAADLIERKQYEEKLRESEEKYRTLFEYMNEGFFLAEIIYDKMGTPVDYLHLAANPALERLVGLKREEIVGKTRSEILSTPSLWIETFNEVALTGRSITFEGVSKSLNRSFLIKVFSPKRGQFACLVQDITKSKELKSEIKRQKELLESVIENMHDALVIYNENGEPTFVNAEARNMHHKLNNQATYVNIQNSLDFFDLRSNVIEKENLSITRIFNGEKIRNKRVVVKGSNKDNYMEVNVTPIFNDENRLTSAVVAYRDISKMIESQQEIKKHQEEVLRAEQEKRETIEAAMKIKDEFLYLITHEFKTPIAVISSVLQTIDSFLAEDLPEKLGRYLNMIKMNTNRQLRLVNNLLDITRLNSGHMKLKRYKIDVVYISRAIVSSVEVYARQKQVNLSFRSDLVKREIYLDEEKFERIMLNLLSNALKFTPSGKNINVFLSIKKRKNRSFISISVDDEGIGIPLEKQKLIFERFGQADTSLSRQAEGTGLGLHLVNLLVGMLEGEILLKSEPGKGSNFTILLPVIKRLELDKEIWCNTNNRLLNSDDRIIEAASIEFSDIYFD